MKRGNFKGLDPLWSGRGEGGVVPRGVLLWAGVFRCSLKGKREKGNNRVCAGVERLAVGVQELGGGSKNRREGGRSISGSGEPEGRTSPEKSIAKNISSVLRPERLGKIEEKK